MSVVLCVSILFCCAFYSTYQTHEIVCFLQFKAQFRLLFKYYSKKMKQDHKQNQLSLSKSRQIIFNALSGVELILLKNNLLSNVHWQ